MTMQHTHQYLRVALSPLAPGPRVPIVSERVALPAVGTGNAGLSQSCPSAVPVNVLISLRNGATGTLGRGLRGAHTHARACVESVCVCVPVSQRERDVEDSLIFAGTVLGQRWDGGLSGVPLGGNH